MGLLRSGHLPTNAVPTPLQTATQATPLQTNSHPAIQTQGQPGTLNGVGVQHAAQNQAPAPAGVHKGRIETFFTKTLPDAFRSAGTAFMRLFQREAPQAATQPVLARVKDAEDMEFPGHFLHVSDKSYAFPSAGEARGAVYAATAHFAEKTAADIQGGTSRSLAMGNFMRSGGLPNAYMASTFGQGFVADLKSHLATAYKGQGVLAFRADPYGDQTGPNGKPVPSGYKRVNDKAMTPEQITTQARRAVDTAEATYARFFGTPGDAASIRAAAARMPQELCDAMAIAIKAVDDSSLSAPDRAKVKDRVGADMIALRLFNPVIFNLGIAKPGQTSTKANTLQQNMVELTKFSQKIANGIPLHVPGSGEAIHPEVVKALAASNTEAKLQATYKAFVAEVLARADPGVVASAKTSGQALTVEFDTAKAVKALRLANAAANQAPVNQAPVNQAPVNGAPSDETSSVDGVVTYMDNDDTMSVASDHDWINEVDDDSSVEGSSSGIDDYLLSADDLADGEIEDDELEVESGARARSSTV